MQFPTTPYTKKGKVLVKILKGIYRILAIFYGKQWAKPLPNFEENPLYYTKKEVLYFGNKYYHKPPHLFNNQVIEYFRKQNLEFSLPAGFVMQNSLTFSVGGDLMPYEWIQTPVCRHLWDEVEDFFFDADLVFANLETPINSEKMPNFVPEMMLSDMMFNGSEEMLGIFNGNHRKNKYQKGFDVLSTANNHSLDMGKEGIVQTIRLLEKHNIRHVGTALSQQEQEKILVLERNHIKIAFIAYTFSLNKFECPKDEPFLVNHLRLNKKGVVLTEIKEKIALAHTQGADLVVLSLHTGNAYQAFPSEHTVEIYHRIFNECGVDIILGSHPHNPQPMERYVFECPFSQKQKQGFAIYSLSDFVAYDIFLWDRLVPLLKLQVQKGQLNGATHTQLTDVQVLPAYNWGGKNQEGNREMRLLPLKKIVLELKKGTIRPYFSKQHLDEIQQLHSFCMDYFLPEQRSTQNDDSEIFF